jgi:hypothetical protein
MAADPIVTTVDAATPLNRQTGTASSTVIPVNAGHTQRGCPAVPAM